MKKITAWCIMALLTIGCKEAQKSKSTIGDKLVTEFSDSLKLDHVAKSKETTLKLTNEDFFSGNIFGQTNIRNHLQSLNPTKVEIQTYQNRHVDNQVDTTYLFYFDSTSIGVYQHPSEQIILSANIDNQQVSLKNGIKIGMTKDDLFTEFNISQNNSTMDTIKISDDVNILQIEFIFQDDRLTEINYEGYMD